MIISREDELVYVSLLGGKINAHDGLHLLRDALVKVRLAAPQHTRDQQVVQACHLLLFGQIGKLRLRCERNSWREGGGGFSLYTNNKNRRKES